MLMVVKHHLVLKHLYAVINLKKSGNFSCVELTGYFSLLNGPISRALYRPQEP